MNWITNTINRVFSSKDRDGLWSLFSSNYSPKTEFNDYANERKKIDAVFSNPALLKVFALQCDLFSLGQIKVYQKGKLIENDPALDRLNNPNPFQSRSQFLWEYMFWNMIGTAYCYIDSDVVTNPANKLYFLDSSKLEFPNIMNRESDQLIFSDSKLTQVGKQPINYRYKDGTMFQFPFSKLLITCDLTNGVGNWYKSPSRINALYKIISNSEAALDAKNINIRYSGKFLVAGHQDPNDVTKLPMAEPERKSIEDKINGNKQVHAVKSMIDIKRFVEDMVKLQLDPAYLADYFAIGNMYNIPRDVLEAYASSTYENQEKARASHVSYTLQPKGDDFMNALSKRWGYDQQNKKIVMDWSYLPFMQVFEKTKAETEEINSRTFVNLVNNGVPLKEVNEYLGLKFTKGGITNATTTMPTTTGN